MPKKGSALGVARARFVEGLPRKAKELKAAMALLVATPDAERPREEMRRRMHALYASAQVFRLEPLADALKEAIARLDAARDEKRGLSQEDLDSLAHLGATLPGLAGEADADASPSLAAPPPGTLRRSSRPPPPAGGGAGPMPEPKRPKRTMIGMAAAPPASTPDATPPQTKVGLGGAPNDSTRAPSAAPSDDVRRPSEPDLTQGTAIGRVKLQKVPARQARGSEPPSSGGSFSVARHGSASRPALADVFSPVVNVLVVDRAATQARIREALPPEHFEMVAAADPEEALRLARSAAPDIVVVDRAIAERSGAELIARLRSDPVTDLVPVAILFDGDDALKPSELREMGADAQIRRDAIEDALEPRLRSLTSIAGATPSAGAFGEATLEEVANRLAKEIHRGLVGAAVQGRDVRVPLGEGSDLMAAAWATIAKVRAELSEASSGQVRFRGAGRGGPAFVSLVGEPGEEEMVAVEDELEPVSLEGVRIVVADDDPAVVWFFAGLFREEGAVVVEVEDGLRALEAARRKRPDLIVSDILMPRMDGLMLCRHLERDPALAEVPVILISWKEDFLQRMRELRAGASGYLRKEAASTQILQRVREVLRPRIRLEGQLGGDTEVRGRVEGIGVIPLLRAVGRLRRNARVTVRDAWNLYEVDIRRGSLEDITRTATDGSFARGRRALMQLLGVTAGRFTVASSESPTRSTLPGGDSDELLAAAAAELGALVDAVSGKRLAKVRELGFDEDIAAAFARTSPPAQRAVVEQLLEGKRPRDLLISGEVEPHVVEEALLDLSRRGAILSVTGPEGADLVAQALEERGAAEPPDQEGMEVPHSALVLPEGEGEVVAPGADGEESSEADAEVAALLDAPTNAPPVPMGDSVRDRMVGASKSARAAKVIDEPAAYPTVAAKTEVLEADELTEVDEAELAAEAAEQATAAETEASADEVMSVDSDVIEAPVKPPPKPPKRPSVSEDEDEVEDDAEGDLNAGPDTTVEPAPLANDDTAVEAAPGLPDEDTTIEVAPGLVDEVTAVEPVRGPSLSDEDTELVPAPGRAVAEPRRGIGVMGWLLLIGFCAVAGFFGFQLWQAQQQGSDTAEPAELPVAADEPAELEEEPSPPEAAEEPASPSEAAGLGFGETVDEVLEVGVEVGEGEGLLVVEAPDEGEAVDVVLRDGDDERELGTAPVSIPLPEGRHRLLFRRGEREQFRYLYVGAGQTRVVDPDTM